MAQQEPGAVDVNARHLIEYVSWKGGYLDGMRLEFHPLFNTLIGGRGSGKSTVIECTRSIFGIPVPEAVESDRTSLLKETLRGSRVELGLRTRRGSRFTVSFVLGQPPTVKDEEGRDVKLSLDGDLFEIEVYGQNEIQSIASDAMAQLALLDKFTESRGRVFAEQIAAAMRKLAENGRAIMALDQQIADDTERVAELPTVEAAIAERAPAAGSAGSEFERASAHRSLRAREAAAFDQWRADSAELRRQAEALASDAARRFERLPEPALTEGPNGQVLASLREAIAREGAEVRAGFGTAIQALARLHETVTEKRRTLDALHTKQEGAFATLAEQFELDQAGLAEKARLEARQIELSTIARRLDERVRARDELRSARSRVLAEVAKLFRERFLARDAAAKEITRVLGGAVRVTIRQAAQVQSYAAFLGEMVKGTGLQTKYIAEVASAIRPDDLAALVLRDNIEPIVAIDGASGDKEGRARKLVEALRKDGKAYEVETFILDDQPLIELKTPARYKPSNELSPGQRSTCLLPILMLLGSGPLIIDQPEDDLDNAFVFDVLVTSIELRKRARQIIFVTHNANLPVLGDAERVFALESDGTRGRLAHVGTVDELREVIERWLEGGSEAFKRRSRRYGHKIDE